MTFFANDAFDGHEFVHGFHDRETGLRGFIAVHSRALGPAFGGCRMWAYDTEAEALRDVLRLSRGMSFKNALAGLPFGGGKAVILGDGRTDKSPALFEAFGRAVDDLGGTYITAEDVGTGVGDMKAVARATRHVSGIGGPGSAGGDPSPMTAWGVCLGIREAVRAALARREISGLRVAVQGAGHVGYRLCRYLHEAGARLVVADVNRDNVARAAHDFGAEAGDPDSILFEDADVVAPCALGAVLDAAAIARLNAPVVAGAANNQLATPRDGELLHQRGILYAPDYVINAGGMIAVAAEYQGNFSSDLVRRRIAGIADRLAGIFERSKSENRPTDVIADAMARELIAGA